MNQIQIYHWAIKINEEEHEVNRTSADEDQISDVTFGDTFDTNKIKRRSDHEDRNKKENSEKKPYEVGGVKRATRGIQCKKHNKNG